MTRRASCSGLAWRTFFAISQTQLSPKVPGCRQRLRGSESNNPALALRPGPVFGEDVDGVGADGGRCAITADGTAGHSLLGRRGETQALLHVRVGIPELAEAASRSVLASLRGKAAEIRLAVFPRVGIDLEPLVVRQHVDLLQIGAIQHE